MPRGAPEQQPEMEPYHGGSCVAVQQGQNHFRGIHEAKTFVQAVVHGLPLCHPPMADD